jgi:DNA-binding NarL/FixJ family response regulator
VQATRLIAESESNARIIILTTFDLDEYVYAALRAGASGFLLKDAPLVICSRRSARSQAATQLSPPASRAGCSRIRSPPARRRAI